jgi:LysM repeat protein
LKIEEPNRDQAERLRKKIENIKDGKVPVPIVKNDLPSRIDLHRNKNNKTKWKVKFPIIRLLALIFILLPVVIFSAYSSLGSKKVNTIEPVNSKESSGFEKINVEEIDNKEVVIDSIGTSDEDATSVNSQDETKEAVEDNVTHTDKAKENDTSSTDNEQLSTKNDDKDSESLVYHTVQPKENLYRIAMKYYQSQVGVEIIQKANHLQGNAIRVGQVLEIPK